ncbi:MAG: GCN5-like N-acetyltransferase [Myxococcaceae bacterium]|nr:GCN5-like N-acetyltransferase [Myxococcaceae bacterium]
MWSHPDVTRYIGGRPFTEEEVWGRVLRYIGHWTALGFGYWAIRERSTGRFVGELGFADFKRDIQPSLAGAPEIGWALSPWAHGQGFATEAVRAVVGWGDQHFPGQRTVCLISPGNKASIRVAEKCGYQEYERTTYKGELTLLFQR